jgi:hypothetical protein
VKDGGVGDEKLLFQAEATAYRLSMPRCHYYYTFATFGRSTNTHARRIVLQASEQSSAVAKPKMQHHIAKPSSMQGTVRSVLGEQI